VSPDNASKAAELVSKSRKQLESDTDKAITQLQAAVVLLKKAENAKEANIRIEALVKLGQAYMARRSGARADNIEQAIRCYNSALRDLYKHGITGNRDDAPDRVRALLAIAYDERVLGSREENIDQILVYTDGLDLGSKEDAELYAATRILRGRAFRDRSPAQGLVIDRHIALSFFEDALKLLRKSESPNYWAEAHLEIGKTLVSIVGSLGRGLEATSWTDAEEHFKSALKVYRRNTQVVKFAVVQKQLGDYYLRCAIEMEEADFRGKALGHYSLSLQCLSAGDNPVEWAQVQVALAGLALGAGIRGYEIAVSHYGSALGALTRPEHSAERLLVLEELTYLQLHARRWGDAIPVFNEALELAQAEVGEAHTVGGRRTAASHLSGLASGLAYCQYQMGQLDQALITLESGKVRRLAETLQWTDNDDAELTAAERKQLAAIYGQIRKLESTQYGGMSWIEDSDRLDVLRQRFTLLVERVRRKRPGILQKDLVVSDMAPSEPGTALVVSLISPVGSALFILTPSDQRVAPENVVPLPEITTRDIDRWLEGDEAADGWLSAHRQQSEGRAEQELWRNTMLDVCGKLWDGVISKLWDRLRELGVSKIAINPTAGLQFLPIHAAAWHSNGQWRYFIDEMTISYAPSAYVLAVSRRRSRAPAVHGPALIAGAGQYQSLPPLSNVEGELGMVGAALDSPTLVDEEASRERVLQEMAGAPVVHLACHGAAWALGGAMYRMAWSPPTVLHLYRDGLSFQDILLQDLRKVRLVCLSACDTGLVDVSLPWDEFEGLANVFLQAGAAAIVSSLWAVDDRSTALLMQRFYENLNYRGQDPAAALREAQLWLRDSTRASLAAVYEKRIEQGLSQFMEAYTDLMLGGDANECPYAHPFYWAPFTLTGI
jgi:CHAT domain-containing protein/tetratricopeptide (TPR) repeat protein